MARRRRWGRALALLTEFEDGCSTPPPRLRQIADAMAVEMHAGLASDGGSKLKMLLTFVDVLPSGDETGTFYAVDFVGTDFRVFRVHLGGKSSTFLRHEVEQHSIPQNVITGTTEELFDFIAISLRQFIEKDNAGISKSSDRRKEIGFAVSFPVKQLSVSSGNLINWSKGYAVGKDVARCLEEAMAKRGLEMRVAALVNDTVGTLALGHYHDKDTVAAVIIGSGINACYVERTEAIIKCQCLLTNSGCMVINMEWGKFWSSHLPRTAYDLDLDDENSSRNDQGFEKMIAGIYMGEIARRVLQRMDQESGIFGDGAHHLYEPFVMRTPLMAAMHEDNTIDLREVGRILGQHLKMPDAPMKVRRLIVRVCDVVVYRAARLTAAGITGILKKIGRDGSGGVAGGRSSAMPPRTVVAIEGSLYSNYSKFRDYLNEALVEILGEEVARHVVLRPSEAGSGLGAALLAASYSSEAEVPYIDI